MIMHNTYQINALMKYIPMGFCNIENNRTYRFDIFMIVAFARFEK